MTASSRGPISNLLVASIAFFIVGVLALGFYINSKLDFLFALYTTFLFMLAFAFLGVYLVERYRKKHGSLMSTR
jgi:hypothetical protein